MPKRAVVMSGGGARGAFQLGAVDYLIRDEALEFDVVTGVSVGSLNAAMLAQGKGLPGLQQQLEALKDIWFGIESERDVYNKRFLAEILIFILNNSLYDPEPIATKINARVDAQRLRDSEREFRLGAVSLDTGKYRTLNQDSSHIPDWVLASSSMPVFFPPVDIDGERWVDGGVRNVTPLRESFAALKEIEPCSDSPEAEHELYVLLAQPFGVEDPPSHDWRTGLPIAERAISILINEIFVEDLAYAITINDSVRSHISTRNLLRARGQLDAEAEALLATFPFRAPQYCPVTIKTIVPDAYYAGDLEFDRVKIREAFEAGRDAAQHHVMDETQVKDALAALA